MNARQAARAAAQRIEELEYANMLYACDVKAYNAVIEGTAEGKSICDWCEWNKDEEHACDPERKGGRGCTDWALMWNHQEGEENNAEEADGADSDSALAGDASGFAIEGRGYDLGSVQAGVIGEHQVKGQRAE